MESSNDPIMGDVIEASSGKPVDQTTVSWWRMNCGRVLGIYDGRLIEYEASTLGKKVDITAWTSYQYQTSLTHTCPSTAPLGLVVGARAPVCVGMAELIYILS